MVHKTHALCRYRLVPTFGRDTIRRFRANTSDLKHMAARDFEDFLQVSMTSVSNCFLLMCMICRPLSLCLRICCPNITTPEFSSCYSILHIGMVSQNLGCTATGLLIFSITRLQCLVNTFVTLKRKSAQPFRQRSCHGK